MPFKKLMEFPSCCHIGFINLVKYNKGKWARQCLLHYCSEHDSLPETKILIQFIFVAATLRTKFLIKPCDLFFPENLLLIKCQLTPVVWATVKFCSLRQQKERSLLPPAKRATKDVTKVSLSKHCSKKPKDQPQQKCLLK